MQLRYAPYENYEYFLCLCSPGEMLPAWTLFLLSGGGTLVRILHQAEILAPDTVVNLLSQAAGMHRFNCTAATVADFLNAEVVA